MDKPHPVPASFPGREEWINPIQFRPLSRGVKKIGLFFRKETSTVQPERSGGRLLVLGKMIRFLATGIKPAAFLFGSVSLSAVRKRNEQSNSAAEEKRSPHPPCEREMNSPIQKVHPRRAYTLLYICMYDGREKILVRPENRGIRRKNTPKYS
jgi:hypothetical protein